jgi:hypothetical protein
MKTMNLAKARKIKNHFRSFPKTPIARKTASSPAGVCSQKREKAMQAS